MRSKATQNIIQRYIVVLFVLILVTAPMHWFKVWRPEWSFWQGSFVDLWAPKLTVSTLLTLLLWIFSLAAQKRPLVLPHFRPFSFTAKHLVGVLLGVSLVANIVLSIRPEVSIYAYTSLFFGPVLFFLWCRSHREACKRWLAPALVLSAALQAAIGLFQYLAQRPLLGNHWFFGEVSARVFVTLPTSQWLNHIWILPQGTTSHTNVLAGWLCLGLFAAWKARARFPSILWSGLVGFMLLTLLATESLAAWVTLPLLFLYAWLLQPPQANRRPWLYGISTLLLMMGLGVQLLNLPGGTSFSHRHLLMTTALQTGIPPQGYGPLQHLVTTSQVFLPETGRRFMQPVHNLPVSLALDLGYCTILLLLLFMIIDVKKYAFYKWLIILSLPIFSLDHYGMTQTSGQFLFLISTLLLHSSSTPTTSYTGKITTQSPVEVNKRFTNKLRQILAPK